MERVKLDEFLNDVIISDKQLKKRYRLMDEDMLLN